MTTFFIDGEPQYWADGPPGPFVPLAEADALEAKIAAQEAALGSCREAFEGLEAELDGLRAAYQELSRLAREVSRMYSDTSWNIGAIRQLTQYIDDKDKENQK